jgi:hypothetical protein
MLKNYVPEDVDHQVGQLFRLVEALRTHFMNRVEGLIAGVPTTPSSQAAGVGNTTWQVNLSPGFVVVNGVAKDFDVQADYSIHSGSMYTDLHSGDSAIATVVAKNVAGTVSLHVVKGAAAVTGSQVAPSDAAIQAAVGAGNAWAKVSECTINRTGDDTCTQSQVNILRPAPWVTVEPFIDL